MKTLNLLLIFLVICVGFCAEPDTQEGEVEPKKLTDKWSKFIKKFNEMNNQKGILAGFDLSFFNRNDKDKIYRLGFQHFQPLEVVQLVNFLNQEGYALKTPKFYTGVQKAEMFKLTRVVSSNNKLMVVYMSDIPYWRSQERFLERLLAAVNKGVGKLTKVNAPKPVKAEEPRSTETKEKSVVTSTTESQRAKKKHGVASHKQIGFGSTVRDPVREPVRSSATVRSSSATPRAGVKKNVNEVTNRLYEDPKIKKGSKVGEKEAPKILTKQDQVTIAKEKREANMRALEAAHDVSITVKSKGKATSGKKLEVIHRVLLKNVDHAHEFKKYLDRVWQKKEELGAITLKVEPKYHTNERLSDFSVNFNRLRDRTYTKIKNFESFGGKYETETHEVLVPVSFTQLLKDGILNNYFFAENKNTRLTLSRFFEGLYQIYLYYLHKGDTWETAADQMIVIFEHEENDYKSQEKKNPEKKDEDEEGLIY